MFKATFDLFCAANYRDTPKEQLLPWYLKRDDLGNVRLKEDIAYKTFYLRRQTSPNHNGLRVPDMFEATHFVLDSGTVLCLDASQHVIAGKDLNFHTTVIQNN